MTPTELRALAKLTVTDDGETMVQVSKRDLNVLVDRWDQPRSWWHWSEFMCGIFVGSPLWTVLFALWPHK